MNTETQTAMILRDLSKGRRITAMDALAAYQCFRLAARILDIRRKGYPIETRMIRSQYGKIVAEYSLQQGTVVLDTQKAG